MIYTAPTGQSPLSWRYVGLFLLLVLMAPLGRSQTEAQTDLPRIKLQVGIHLIDAQLAQTPQHHQIGLMFRQEMPEHEGMLFVFETAKQQCFWMKNTVLPLTAAFLDDAGRIVNLASMTPRSTQSHCSARPVRYVLELQQVWFEKRKIKAGDRVLGLP